MVDGFVSLFRTGEKAAEHVTLMVCYSQQRSEYNTVCNEYLGHDYSSSSPLLYNSGA